MGAESARGRGSVGGVARELRVKGEGNERHVNTVTSASKRGTKKATNYDHKGGGGEKTFPTFGLRSFFFFFFSWIIKKMKCLRIDCDFLRNICI